MKPSDIKAARKVLGLSQDGLAEALRMTGANRDRTVRNWEKEGNTVPGPVQVAVEALLMSRTTGHTPPRTAGRQKQR